MGAPPGIDSNATQAATRRALLDAAAAEFAGRGFHGATVRDICRQAGANVAAVNYHFGDKESLYSEVLAELSAQAQKRFPAEAGLPPDAAPRQRLAAFIRSLLQRVLSEELSARHGRIMAREMVEPTDALNRLVREFIQPQADLLRDILRDLLPASIDPETSRLCALSIVGQILFYAHCRPVLQRLKPEGSFDRLELDRLARHITEFSLAALEVLGGRGSPGAVAAPRKRPVRTRSRSRS
ncbi:MAG: CerR family C-terminal domain-containing protein [Verrucomicrobiales bacterium]|nr:CerR family C-terminal domain-containing protein [Verrucomicrobiales bacterium]